MEIDIYSDTICPWCFIGKRRLERALAERPGRDYHITWRAFQLNPDMPGAGMERRRYLEAKFGGPEAARAVYGRIDAAGRKEGIEFAFERIARTPNTLQSHRLIRYAHRQGLQDALVEALFAAYFLRGEDIGDPAVLRAIATEAGLEPEAAARYLAEEEDRDAVAAEDLNARLSGITGVPCFIFNRQHVLAGAQPPEVLLRLFDLIEQDTQTAGTDTTATGQ